MPRRRLPVPRLGRWKVVSALLALAGALVWQFTPAPAVFAISNLSDPAKLATLGKRGANPRVNKIVYWLDDARRHGLSPERTLAVAQFLNGTQGPRAALVRETQTRNVQIADELGLFTPENRRRLREGRAARVTLGPHTGQEVEIDHIVPVSLAPEAGNELANLEMLPEKLNRQKSNRVTERQREFARRLAAAGLLSEASLQRVLTAR